ncbi:hypothetical protein Mic7113_0211 [Allocoleopsis franciscana PCC 7113]|uniref:Uncharacterized protein n=1 Tax=Allocoleopsis franciscana PCC 7113 TaxID=1173027 RepID=K9W702_9CYAN|nr:hypothetical protein Mic7113_0211 [Allocoleopsis franciscana PCC 7113]
MVMDTQRSLVLVDTLRNVNRNCGIINSYAQVFEMLLLE